MNEALAAGFAGLRVMGDATCFFEYDMDEQLIMYENSLHKELEFPMTALCAYSLPAIISRNRVQLVVDLIHAHKNVIFMGSTAGLLKACQPGA